MNENKILNMALEYIDKSDVERAFSFLLEGKKELKEVSGQYYNFLYCLAALTNNNDDALNFLEEAILEKELWYRTEVFEDDDLNSIREDERFINCFKISEKRFKLAKENARTVNTWKKRVSNKLAIGLHGNQQNINDSKEYWDFLCGEGYQVEYIQSSEIDSCGIFRWEDEGSGPKQLANELKRIMWDEYDKTVFCGFSSGCNTILRCILSEGVECTSIIMQSPWIPMIDTMLDEITDRIEELNINILIICGTEDKDCMPNSKRLYESLKKRKLSVVGEWIEEMNHDFPLDFDIIVRNYLNMVKD